MITSRNFLRMEIISISLASASRNFLRMEILSISLALVNGSLYSNPGGAILSHPTEVRDFANNGGNFIGGHGATSGLIYRVYKSM